MTPHNARGAIVTIVALAATILAVSPSAGPDAIFNPPKQFYLALGDSFAYGFQFSKVGMPPEAFDTGYVDVFAAHMLAIQPGLTTVNYGCVGETTVTFIKGPCLGQTLGVPLHDFYTGSQLDAAVAFLRAHPRQVSPITVTLWSNDIRLFVESCQDQECVAEGAGEAIKQIIRNLTIILGRLRGAAPDAEIIVTGAWDSFLNSLEFADPLFQAMNAQMAAATMPSRSRFADPFPIFNPQGDLQVEIGTICTLTLLCTEHDGHPSDAGYRALGDLVFDVSGYNALLP